MRDLTSLTVGDKIGIVYHNRRDMAVYEGDVTRVTKTHVVSNLKRFRRETGWEVSGSGRAYPVTDAEFIELRKRAVAEAEKRERESNKAEQAREARFGIVDLAREEPGAKRFLHWLAEESLDIERKITKAMTFEPWRLNHEIRFLSGYCKDSVVLEYYLYLFKLAAEREPGVTIAELTKKYRADLIHRFMNAYDGNENGVIEGFAAREAERQIGYRAIKDNDNG